MDSPKSRGGILPRSIRWRIIETGIPAHQAATRRATVTAAIIWLKKNWPTLHGFARVARMVAANADPVDVIGIRRTGQARTAREVIAARP